MPLLKTKQALSSMEIGQVLKVEASDAGAWRDIPAFVALSPHVLLGREEEGELFVFYILKGE
jgi:Predicted redox protein, regulator of disulfide bond formation